MSTTRHSVFGALALMLSTIFCPAAAPVVSNVWSAQIPGTHEVRIEYDLVADGPCDIQVQFSLNGGESYSPSLTDDLIPETIRKNVTPGNRAAGTQKAITLTVRPPVPGAPTALDSLHNQFTKNLRFKVLATPTTTPPGFEHIPAGDFQMGDQSNPLVGRSDELPVHSVYVSGFYMAKYETTKELWDEVKAWGLLHDYADLAAGNGGYASKGVNHPVHSITWYDILKWCNARSEMENLVPCYYTDSAQTAIYKTGITNIDNSMVKWTANGYRLPTEAEWEKAARDGVPGKNFPWGDTIGHNKANYYSSSYSYEDDPKNQGFHPSYTAGGYPYSSPVGSFAPQPNYGLYDMAGNMWERCWDWYSGSYYASSPKIDPRGATSSSARVFRGGGWYDDGYAGYTRCASRASLNPAETYSSSGFRLARSLP